MCKVRRVVNQRVVIQSGDAVSCKSASVGDLWIVIADLWFVEWWWTNCDRRMGMTFGDLWIVIADLWFDEWWSTNCDRRMGMTFGDLWIVITDLWFVEWWSTNCDRKMGMFGDLWIVIADLWFDEWWSTNSEFGVLWIGDWYWYCTSCDCRGPSGNLRVVIMIFVELWSTNARFQLLGPPENENWLQIVNWLWIDFGPFWSIYWYFLFHCIWNRNGPKSIHNQLTICSQFSFSLASLVRVFYSGNLNKKYFFTFLKYNFKYVNVFRKWWIYIYFIFIFVLVECV